jgi:hypothetical protein
VPLLPIKTRDSGRSENEIGPGKHFGVGGHLCSLTGALPSSVSTWITQRHQDRRDLLAKRIFHREQLYSDFISETARAMGDAIQHNFQDPNTLTPIYALLSRIRLSSSADVLGSAETVMQRIIIYVFGA